MASSASALPLAADARRAPAEEQEHHTRRANTARAAGCSAHATSGSPQVDALSARTCASHRAGRDIGVIARYAASMLPLLLLAAAPAPLTTLAEQSGYTRTGRYDEVEALCARLPQALPRQGELRDLRHDAEGRPLLRFVACADGDARPPTPRERRRARWSCSRAASTPARSTARTPASGCCASCSTASVGQGVLEQVTRRLRARLQRRRPRALRPPTTAPTSAGPEEMGWRIDRAEPQPQPRLREGRRARDAGDAAPARRVGSRSSTSTCTSPTARKFQHDVSVLLRAAPDRPRRPERHRPRRREVELIDELETQGHLPVDFYPSFLKDDDPRRASLSACPRRGFARLLVAAQPLRRAGRDAQLEAVRRAREGDLRRVAGLLTRVPRAGLVARRRSPGRRGRCAARLRSRALAWENTASR